MIYEVLQTILYSDLGGDFNNGAMLVFRVLLAYELVRVHGLGKFGENGKAETVENPFGLPPKLNQAIADFSDLVAPVFVALGAGTRLAALPVLGVTLTGYFIVHRNDSPKVRDVPFMYSLCFLLIAALGAGKFSVDYYLLRLFGGN